jgi:hypothetical protein
MILRLAVAIIFVFILAPKAMCQSDSITTAMDIINDFSMETGAALTGIEEAPFSLPVASAESREKTLSELESVRLAYTPGASRFRRIYSIVAFYIDSEIASIRSALQGLWPDDAVRVEKASTRLSYLKEEKLSILTGSIGMETFEKDAISPVPLIDASPFEQRPEEAPGIWYR